MTSIIFDGAEVPSNRILLEAAEARNLGMSYWRLKRRGLPKTKEYFIAERFNNNVEVFVDSGFIPAAGNKTGAAELEDYAAEYVQFIKNNADRITGATEFYAPSLGAQWQAEHRASFEDLFGDVVWPVWTHEQKSVALFSLAEQYGNVAIPHESIESDTTLAPRINALINQHGTQFHALATAKPDNLRSIKFETATTLSWLSPMMRGETIVWDGGRLVRYPKKMKDQARIRYRHIVEQAGLDFDKIIGDDSTEITRLAIWSYQQLEASMQRSEKPYSSDPKLVDNSEFRDDPGNAETLGVDVDNRDLEVRKNFNPVPVKRDPSEQVPLPVMGFDYKTIVEQDEHGRDILKEVPVVRSSAVSVRQCNTCFVAQTCPAMKADSECSFNFPVEVKTKEQLRSLLNGVIEMQAQRVAFGRFAEEMNGGYADPNTSQEIDRLFKLVKTVKELEDNREFIRITAERQTSGGILSAVFGDRAAALRDLPNGGMNADQTNQIIDGQIVEG